MSFIKRFSVGSLFSGVGGFDLALQRLGMIIKWQVEINDNCNRVLERRFPDVKRHRDVNDCGIHNLEKVDLICGGFPCQDISIAGAHQRTAQMLEGDKSSLLYQFSRIVGELKPKWILVENVSNVQQIEGQVAEAFCDYWVLSYKLKASDFGAYTRRERIFFVGHIRDGGKPVLLSVPRRDRPSFRTGGREDILPMCLPWKGGLNLERLGSTVIHHPKTYPFRIRTGNGIS